jgi:HSP20 family protein
MMVRTPRREIETLRERFDNLFGDFMTWPRPLFEPTLIPMDVKETDTELVVTATLPGFKPEEIEVDVTGDLLTVKAETKEEHEETEGTWHLRERRYGAFRRVFTLPVPIYTDETKAVYENGVLTLTFPKSERIPKQRIQVNGT